MGQYQRYFFVWVFLSLIPPSLMAQSELSSYRWENRLILLFYPSDTSEGLQYMLKEIEADKAEIADRDLVIFQLVEEGNSRVGNRVLGAKEAQEIRSRYRIKSGQATLILIGKDGGEKLRQEDSAIDLKVLYPLIDGMPMRRQEMRPKGSRL